MFEHTWVSSTVFALMWVLMRSTVKRIAQEFSLPDFPEVIDHNIVAVVNGTNMDICRPGGIVILSERCTTATTICTTSASWCLIGQRDTTGRQRPAPWPTRLEIHGARQRDQHSDGTAAARVALAVQLVGDKGYAVLSHIAMPFGGDSLPPFQRAYNLAVSQMRVTV